MEIILFQIIWAEVRWDDLDMYSLENYDCTSRRFFRSALFITTTGGGVLGNLNIED